MKNSCLPILKINRIIFWEPSMSPHKVAFFSAIAKISPDIEIICCANNELSVERQKQGWAIISSKDFQTIIAPNNILINQLVKTKVSSTLHIFSGIRWVPVIVAGLKAVRLNGANFAIMSEPRVSDDWRGKMRYLHSWITEGWLRRNSKFILAQGKNGPPWFCSVGYPIERIFPFAYFIDLAERIQPHARGNDYSHLEIPPIQVGYAGRLVAMKGIFDLVEAMAILGPTARLSLVGLGPERDALKARCSQLKIDAEFIDVIPIQDMGNFMRKLDVLVLASTAKDGWGVVVSEALMAGTAVIVTPCVGASLMLNEPLFGCCVPAESPTSIANAIYKMQVVAAYTEKERIKREILARSRLSAKSGARHLLEIIEWQFCNGKRPIPFNETKIGKSNFQTGSQI